MRILHQPRTSCIAVRRGSTPACPNRAWTALLLLLLLAPLGSCSPDAEDADEAAGKIHASTVSREALRLYLEGLRLQENLRATEANELFQRAILADPEFALAHLGAAQTSPTGSEFFDHLERAIELADLASEGEKHLVYAFAAGVNSDPVAQERHARALVETHPSDQRAHTVLGNLYFGRQEYAQAIEQYRRAIALDPRFPPPYNQLGYSHRFLGDYAAAEEAFRTYVELIPDEPNPYDSYAELLMKAGRFAESIEQYQKALERDPGFVASRIGVGLNRIFLGDVEGGRAAFEALHAGARGDGERRQALTWLAHSRIFEGDTDGALAEVERRLQVAAASADRSTMAGDLAFMGRILLEAGRLDEAAERFAAAVTTMEESGATAEVKQALRHNQLYNEARVALGRGDLAGAKAAAAVYGPAVERRSITDEARAHRELLGRIAIAEQDWPAAIGHLAEADQQNPVVLYLLAIAHRGAGDLERARELAGRAANWNGLGESYAFVRAPAIELAAQLGGRAPPE